MEGLGNSPIYSKQSQKMFDREPWLVYLTIATLGIGCSSVFPSIAEQLNDRDYRNLKRSLPHVYDESKQAYFS